MRARLRRVPALPLGLTVLVLATLLGQGCGREPEATRAIRLSAERYLDALARKDFDEIRKRATCLVPVQSVQGGNVLRIDPTRSGALGTLDSLASVSARLHRATDSLWIHAGEGNREAMFQASRRAGRLEITYRNALHAISVSLPDSLPGSKTRFESCAVRVRVRYAGELVGPKPVDREMILRMLRAPAGAWIAFSLYTVEDDPRPDGV
ncbi:MAG: hypothetical protein ACRENN_01775 [Candidatus Eiseniibacteriota bacterium]